MVTNEDLIAHWCANGIDPDRCYYTGTDNPENLVPCLPVVKRAKNTCTAGEFLALLDTAALGIAV